VEGCLQSCNGEEEKEDEEGLEGNSHGLASANLLVSLLTVEGVIT
jgi:hypothetical protein